MTIRFDGVTFAYPGSGENVFENLSFSVDTEWKTGLIGRNGRGKTTLLRLMAGEFEGEYSGSIRRPAGAELFPCPVREEDMPALDALEELCGAEEWRLRRELSALGLRGETLSLPFSALSGGERTRALLAAMFLREGRFLLIDEPTNHLDGEAKAAIAAYLKQKRGFLLVSHDREFLDECVDHILAVNRSDVEVQAGNYSSWRENADRRERFEREKNEKLRAEIGRLKDSARRTAGWSARTEAEKFGVRDSGLKADRGYVGHKAAKLMKASKVIEARKLRAAEEKSALLKNLEESGSLKIFPLEFYRDRLLEVKDFVALRGGIPVSPPLSFSIFAGDRVALNGKNGSGKSSVLHAILGREAYLGSLEKPPQLKISFAEQEARPSGTPAEYARACGVDAALFFSVLARLGFSGKDFSADLSEASEGQKKKAVLARSLSERAHLYVWDEPLNFIDVLSRVQIEELILEFRPTLLFVEHDGAFRKNVATRTVEL